jgi:hypothetical protein
MLPAVANTLLRWKGREHDNMYPATHETCGLAKTGGIFIMKPNTDKPQAPESKPESKPNAKPDGKDDLKTLPLAEVKNKLGSSPDGLSQAEAQKRPALKSKAPSTWKTRFNSDSYNCGPKFADHSTPDVETRAEKTDGLPCSGEIGIGPYTVVILSQDE